MNLNQRLYTGFIIALLMVLAIGFVNYKTMMRRKLENAHLLKSYEVMHQLTTLEKLLVDMETARRGYRITGKQEFLTPYLLARPQMDVTIANLKNSLDESPAQKALLRRMEQQIAGMRAFYLTQPAGQRSVSADSLSMITDMEKQMMDSARVLTQSLHEAEKSQLMKQQEVTRELFQEAAIIIITGTILTELLILLLFLAILRALHLRRNTQSELQAKMQEVENTNETVRQKNWLLTGISQIKDKLQGATDTNQMAMQVLQAILSYTGAPGGAIYVLDEEDKTHLLLAGSVGVPTSATPVVQVGRGLVGSVAQSEQTTLIEDVPAGYWQFESHSGNARPGSLLLVPFCSNHNLRGIIELASFGSFPFQTRQLVEEVATNIAVAFTAIAASNQATRLLMQVREQKEALEQQQEELHQTNEALTRQAEELQVSEEELRVQEEELRQVNAELQEKNKAMEAARHDLEQQAQELAQSSRYKSEFLANMSHELRTPLNAVLLLARILADNKEGNLTGRQAKLAATIHKSGEDLLHLINDILDLSKIEAGKATLNLEQTSLPQAFQHLKEQFAALAEEKQIHFDAVLEPGVPVQFTTDSVRLLQVLRNLLSNAFKFTPAGGRITLRGSMAGDQLCLTVTDTGIGIAPDKQQLIFEAFQQADGSTSRRFGGTGLGLSISREIMHLLGGAISLQSIPGKGSTFTVCLPLTIPEGASATEVGSILPESLPKDHQVLVPDDRHEPLAHQKRVLIIEDDPDFATLLRNVARDAGYLTIVALRGDEGLVAARQYTPDAILLDMHLPGLNGWQLLRIFQEEEPLRQVPVHIISAMDGNMPVGAGITVLKKPLSKQELETAFRVFSGGAQLKAGRVLLLQLQGAALAKQLEERMPALSITASATAEAAVARLEAEQFDCLIADLGADIKKGIQSLEALQPALSRQQTPVIIYLDGALDGQEERLLRKRYDVVIHSGEKSAGRLQHEVESFLNQLDQHNPEAQPAAGLQNDAFFAGRKILVADDDMRNLFALSALLEEQGMEVIAAADGREALSLLSETPGIEAVLIDIMMPEMDGYEVIRDIRKEKKWKQLPVITLTAKAMAGDREESLKAGASDYISKPVDPQRLLSLLRVWLAR